jgi:hypothetical protein
MSNSVRGGSKEVRELVRKLRRLGYVVTSDSPGRNSSDSGRSTKRGNGHLRVLDTSGLLVGVLPNTPSCPRTMKNVVASLRRKGVNL